MYGLYGPTVCVMAKPAADDDLKVMNKRQLIALVFDLRANPPVAAGAAVEPQDGPWSKGSFQDGKIYEKIINRWTRLRLVD